MHAEDRKLAIVKAALPLFARNGFAATTTKELARAAGVSEPLLYKHFPSKEALYLEIQNFTCKATDLAVERLKTLPPTTSSLVQLVYYLLRALIEGLPRGPIEWETRHRLTINSFLEDGTFARVLYRTRFDSFCSQMESCLEAAIAAGDATRGPIRKGNRARLAHHVGAWLALAHLPQRPVIDYKVSRAQLLESAVWFSLRGMGVKDKALAKHFNPKALAEMFAEN